MIKKLLTSCVLVIMMTPLFVWAEKYAVLINGDLAGLAPSYLDGQRGWNNEPISRDSRYLEFWLDVVLKHEILIKCGFTDDHIFVLYGNGEDFDPKWLHNRYDPYWGNPDVTITDFAAYLDDVRTVFNGLAYGDPNHGIPRMTEDDFLYVWTFDHGVPDYSGHNNVHLCLMDGWMSDYEFAELVDQIAYDKRVFTMQQCGSGGFIDNLENQRTFIVAACAGDESAYPADDIPYPGGPWVPGSENEIREDGRTYSHGEFNFHLMNALHGQTPTGEITRHPHPDSIWITPDSNGDGFCSINEACRWVDRLDSHTWETTQYSDPGNIGRGIFLNEMASVTPSALAHNNARRLIRDELGTLQLLYVARALYGMCVIAPPPEEEWSCMDRVYYAFSSDNGATWSGPTCISGSIGGCYSPAMAMDRSGVFHALWIRKASPVLDAQLLYAQGAVASVHGELKWSSPQLLWSDPENLYAPSLVVDDHGTAHVVVEGHQDERHVVYYGSFETILSPCSLEPVVVDCGMSPSISWSWSGFPDIVWEKDGEIYHAVVYDMNEWPSENISESPDLDSRRPFIWAGDRELHVVWQEESQLSPAKGIYEAVYRHKVIGSHWDDIVNLSASTNAQSLSPIGIADYPLVTWAEDVVFQEPSHYDIYLSKFLGPGSNMSNTEWNSYYPQVAFQGCPHPEEICPWVYLYTAWMDDLVWPGFSVDIGPFDLKIQRTRIRVPLEPLFKSDSRPAEFVLFQNYPNPFNPHTEIEYGLPRDGHVRLEVFNLAGQKVANLVNEDMKSGYHTVRWNGTGLASGTYFYRLQIGDFAQTKTMMLIK